MHVELAIAFAVVLEIDDPADISTSNSCHFRAKPPMEPRIMWTWGIAKGSRSTRTHGPKRDIAERFRSPVRSGAYFLFSTRYLGLVRFQGCKRPEQLWDLPANKPSSWTAAVLNIWLKRVNRRPPPGFNSTSQSLRSAGPASAAVTMSRDVDEPVHRCVHDHQPLSTSSHLRFSPGPFLGQIGCTRSRFDRRPEPQTLLQAAQQLQFSCSSMPHCTCTILTPSFRSFARLINALVPAVLSYRQGGSSDASLQRLRVAQQGVFSHD